MTCKACVRCEGDVALGIDVHHTVRGVDLLAVPGVKVTPLIAVMVSGLPSASLSFTNGFKVTGVLNAVLYAFIRLQQVVCFGVGANGEKVSSSTAQTMFKGLITDKDAGYSIPKVEYYRPPYSASKGWMPSAIEVSPTLAIWTKRWPPCVASGSPSKDSPAIST